MGMVNPKDIDAHHLFKLRCALLQKGLLPAQNPCTTDKNIETAKAVDRLLDSGLNGRFLCHIGVDIERRLPEGLNLCNDRGGLGIQHIEDGDSSSFLCNPQSTGSPQPTSSPCNQSNPVFFWCSKA